MFGLGQENVMDYSDYQYLWPPRPEKAVPVSSIGFMASMGGYGAQVKKNGTCTVIFARGKEVIFKTRHGEDGNHKAWTPKPEHIKFFQSKGDKWNVWVAELIHSKTPHIKDQLYIFDKIVHEGVQLVGKTFMERMDILHADWKPLKDEGDQIRVGPHVSVAKVFTEDFLEIWKTLKPEDEGLVFKRKTAKLERCMKQTSNNSWQVKCRRPHTNYSF
jgi:hypothetical protein